MTITKDVFLSLLAADAYNRGYAAQLQDQAGNDPDGLGIGVNPLGNANVLALPNEIDVNDWQAAGFYAVAYEVKAGAWEDLTKDTVVISYRGSDFFRDEEELGIGGDLAAYKIARGGTEVDQFNLAIEFYKSVVASLQSYGDSLLNTLIK